MDQGDSALNQSSLIDLKAELHKKYEAFRNLKNKSGTSTSKISHLKHKGQPVKESKIKQKPVLVQEGDPEEELALKRSREALEAKAKLYEKIVSNNILVDDEQKDCYLVDFQRKVLYEPGESSKAGKKETDQILSSSNQKEYPHVMISTPISSSIRGKGEKSDIEEPEQPIHYQNVHFNEVRDHGTSYFSFSVNETKRKEQMEELSTMRHETEEQRLKKQKLEKKRQTILQARLAKICERKNIDLSVLESFKTVSDDEAEQIMQSDEIDITDIPLPEVKPESENNEPIEKKLPKIRPWDIGKDNLQHFVPEKRIKSQKQWIEEKREERLTEFAPPSLYTKNSHS